MDTRPTRPLVLVRGFGFFGIDDERANAYQGFNEGTVYPHRQGENYIYEGFVLRALKSPLYAYDDATNAVGYYSRPVDPLPGSDGDWSPDLLTGKVVANPGPMRRWVTPSGPGQLWVYRYYDLEPRDMRTFGAGLVRLLLIVEAAHAVAGRSFDGVDVVAHSMGGLIVHEAVRQLRRPLSADDWKTVEIGGPAPQAQDPNRLIHRIVTLGTPHRGIAFNYVPELFKGVAAGSEMKAFSPDQVLFLDAIEEREGEPPPLPRDHVLTVVGTDYRSYGIRPASAGNRLSGLLERGDLAYNRSDGLVQQASAQLPGAPRTFVHKCHGGPDSLVTSRESYEAAVRFFHGTKRVELRLDSATIKRGGDRWFGSEYFFGVSVKPRGVDFDLVHQSIEAENCYGPFRSASLDDDLGNLEESLREPLSRRGDDLQAWAGPGRLVWEGWLDPRARATPAPGTAGGTDAAADQGGEDQDLAFRLDVYVGERDKTPIGFSDDVIFRKQYVLQVFAGGDPQLFVHQNPAKLQGEETRRAVADDRARSADDPLVDEATRVEDAELTWTFDVGDDAFEARFRVAVLDAAQPR